MKLAALFAAALCLAPIACTKTAGSGGAQRNPWTVPGHLRIGIPEEPDALNPMFAHTDAHVDRYLEAVNAVFRDLRIAIDQKAVRQLLRGPVAHSGFYRRKAA